MNMSMSVGCRPDLVIPDHQLRRLLPPNAAIRLSGSRIGAAHGRRWIGRRMAAFLTSLRASLAGLPPCDLPPLAMQLMPGKAAVWP